MCFIQNLLNRLGSFFCSNYATTLTQINTRTCTHMNNDSKNFLKMLNVWMSSQWSMWFAKIRKIGHKKL